MATATDTRKIAQAVVYFFLSTAITWYFIECGSSLYHFNRDMMLLSCSIAGAKWAIQILAAFFLLKEQRWLFISNIAFTCFIGSCILISFCITSVRNLLPGNGFLISLIAAVAAMLVLYYYSVRSSEVSVKWYFLWVTCLAIAISLQLTVVFGVFNS